MTDIKILHRLESQRGTKFDTTNIRESNKIFNKIKWRVLELTQTWNDVKQI